MTVMMISKLPRDLVEEILSRVSVTSMGAVRSTCRKWNTLSKDKSFIDKHIGKASREKEFLMMTRDYRVYLINFNVYKTHDNKFDLSVKRKGTLVTRETSGEVISIRQVCQCNGLLLCALRDFDNMFVVLNPYWGKRRWIRGPINGDDENFYFGYDKSCGSHKILMFCYPALHYEIYDLSSDYSWRVIKATDPNISYFNGSIVCLKGDSYWLGTDNVLRDHVLLCFDFTRERFGLGLPLPVDYIFEADLSLSAVREEQLALLVRRWKTSEMEVWVTSKIEPNAVSWRNFFNVDYMPIPLAIDIGFNSFFIVEEKKIVVVFGEGMHMFNTYIIENGNFTKVDLRKCIDIQLEPFAGSYVPTSAQIE